MCSCSNFIGIINNHVQDVMFLFLGRVILRVLSIAKLAITLCCNSVLHVSPMSVYCSHGDRKYIVIIIVLQ